MWVPPTIQEEEALHQQRWPLLLDMKMYLSIEVGVHRTEGRCDEKVFGRIVRGNDDLDVFIGQKYAGIECADVLIVPLGYPTEIDVRDNLQIEQERSGLT